MPFTLVSRDLKLGAEAPAQLSLGQLTTSDPAARPVPCVVVLPHHSLPPTLQSSLAPLSGTSLPPVLPTLGTR